MPILSMQTILLGLAIMSAQALVLTIGTLRTLFTCRGSVRLTFPLAAAEVSLWLAVISTVLAKVTEVPALGVFYVLGFGLGNVTGILVERRLALGAVSIRVITATSGREMADRVRLAGYCVTTLAGEGLGGPVDILYIACRRRDVGSIVSILRSVEPAAFYTVESASEVSWLHRPRPKRRRRASRKTLAPTTVAARPLALPAA